MTNKVNVKGYFDTVNAPWGKIFYELAWHHLEFEGKRILDFGSGFGLTANHLAKKNDVVAVEPNEEMLEYRVCENEYEQIVGSIESLKSMPDNSFDVIVCHNVLEYMNNREEVLAELSRLLKDDGMISIIKHNKAGKIMQKVVFEYNVEDALKLLENENVASVNFGVIDEYENGALETYSKGKLKIENVYGLRMFYALQRNELKTDEAWLSNMFEIECKAEQLPEFRDIAFFHHVILKPNTRNVY